MVKFTGMIKKKPRPLNREEQFRADRIQAAADYNRQAPFSLVLTLEGTDFKYPWGQFREAGRAHKEGQKAMIVRGRSDLPHGKRCLGYVVYNVLTGAMVGPNGEPQ